MRTRRITSRRISGEHVGKVREKKRTTQEERRKCGKSEGKLQQAGGKCKAEAKRGEASRVKEPTDESKRGRSGVEREGGMSEQEGK